PICRGSANRKRFRVPLKENDQILAPSVIDIRIGPLNLVSPRHGPHIAKYFLLKINPRRPKGSNDHVRANPDLRWRLSPVIITILVDDPRFDLTVQLAKDGLLERGVIC